MGLLDSLEKLGIKNVDADEMYKESKETKVKKEEPKEKKEIEIKEEDFLLQKTYVCPICDSKFKDLSLKSGKARLVDTAKNLRPKYEHIEPLKYEALVCPKCGYAVMGRYLGPLAPTQKKNVLASIGNSFNGNIKEKTTYTFDEALERITLALASAIVKNAKASEKAYICLKGGWLCEAYLDTLDPDDAKQEMLCEEIREKEREFMDNAYDGFLMAMQSEGFPIGGMDEVTLDYLVAVMAFEKGAYDVAAKRVASILQSRNAPTRIKEKARDLREELAAAIKSEKV